MIRRAAAVVAALAVVCGAAIFAKADALDAQRADAVASATVAEAQARAAEARGGYLAESVSRAEAETALLAQLLDVRPAFVVEVTALSAAIVAADGKVDTAAHKAAALSTQQTVLDERRDPDTVIKATATIHALTEKVTGEVATWESAQRAQSAGPGGPRWSSSGPGGYANVRAALDRVGGGGVGLYESSSCAGGNAPACANSNGYIKYRPDIATWSAGRLNWAMAHELAHIYQFRVWSALNASGAYDSLFGGNPEFLANCMAVVRGYPGSVGCNDSQRSWASGIWVGAVR